MHIIAAVNVGDSLQQAFNSFFGFLPNLLGFLIILVVGYIVARVGAAPRRRAAVGPRSHGPWPRTD
jgi:putative Mn2+ efflux pump MntP